MEDHLREKQGNYRNSQTRTPKMNSEDLEEKIIQFLQAPPQSAPVRNLIRAVAQKGSEGRRAFFQALNDLIAKGKVTETNSSLVRLAAANQEGTPATIVALCRGFAFARPDNAVNDIFIPAENLKDAIVGDRVTLINIQQREKGPSAEVGAVTERASRTVTGMLRTEIGRLYFVPDIPIRYSLPVLKPGTVAAKDGDKVQAKIYRIPHTSGLAAEPVKIYGKANSARICADAILDRYGIVSDFSKEALAEADRSASRGITPEDRKERLDLRDLPICTIDSAEAKDLDDAVSVIRTPEGGYSLGVHIADVSHYIVPNGVLDLEARSRGTSVYFADRVVPMLPVSLSNGVCSLNAGEDKLAFSALIDMDGSGNIVSYHFNKSVICSKVRGVYSEVNSLFDGTAGEELRRKYSPVIDSLDAARELAKVLQKQASASGAIDLESTESEFELDENGFCIGIRPHKSGEAEQMIERLMISANRAAAMLAKSEKIPFVYRVHEQPAADRVDTLVHLVDAAGLNSAPLKHSDGKIRPMDFSAVLTEAKGTPAQKVISHQVLRTMAKARYDVQPLGHFGLALADYCHFTSPIRRYPDTAIHRILSALLRTNDKAEMQEYASFASEAAKLSSDAEVRAMCAERDAEDCYMAEYMTRHVGETYDGVVSGVTMRGVFVELENTVEGFVPMESFPDSDYHFDGALSQVDAKTGARITIGTALHVRAVSAEVATGKIDFVSAQE